MKRKALVILTVAILAFAMIPALGAGAAAGKVKIVTPHELAAPSGDDDSAFDNLAGADFVSDVTGQANMADTYGTLYAVIEDNDSRSNRLTTYTAYFDATSITANQVFNISDDSGDVYPGSHDRIEPTEDEVAAADAANFEIADREKDGEVGSEDVTVYLAYTDSTTTPPTITTDRLRVDFVVDAFGSTVTLDVPSARQTNLSGVRIEFATAGPDEAVVNIRSAAGDEITIAVTEKDISYYAELDNDIGVNSEDFGASGAVSVDSGTFVGSFGLIRNAWKDMISEWATDAQEDGSHTAAITTAVATTDLDGPDGDIATTDDNAPHPVALLIELGAGNFLIDSNGDGMIDAKDVTASFTPVTGNLVLGDSTVGAEHPASEANVVLTSISARNAQDVDCDGDGTVLAADFDAGVNSRVACVTIDAVTVVGINTFEDADGDGNDDAATTTDDSVTFTFKTESNAGALLTAVQDTETVHDAFEELGDGRAGLTAALNNQGRNLGIERDAATRASDLVGRLLGVEDKGIVEVRYPDPSPQSTQRATATVDLAAPTVGGFNPAKGSFTTQDSFEVLFTVTDTGAGIPEDAEDTDENTVGNTGTALVAVTVSVGDGGSVDVDAGDNTPDVSQTKEDVQDGYQYETDVDVARNANNTDNINVTVTVTAYDLAGNSDDVTATYIIDTKDPALLGALTGVGAKLNNDLARDTKAEPTKGAYEIIENDPTWIALVFDDAINGALLEPAEVIIAGEQVDSLLWLDGSGANVVTTEGDAMNRETITEDNGAGLNLDSSGLAQSARHVLFVKLAAAMDSSSRPAVEIDASDLEDLAGNQDRTDHTIARAHDRLSPVLTVTVVNPLSNSALDVNIESSEDLRRIPSAAITHVGDNPTDRSLAVKRVGSGWAIEATARSIGQTTGGVRTISVSAEDEDGNSITKTAKWELDVQANGGVAPQRVGEDDSTKAHGIETNPVTFLSLNFAGEADEYDDDSKSTVDITSVSLETLSAGSVKTDGTIQSAANIEVTETAEVDAAAIQSSNQITHVVALSELALGNYRLQVNYSDVAGNTGKFGYVFKIDPPSPATVDLVPGWSLVSIPGTPQDKSIGGVLEGTSVTDVWSLSNETKVWEFARKDENGEWMGTLSQMVDGRAYFVRSTTFDDIEVLTERFSPQRTPSQYTVTAGWNGIGYTPAGDEKSISVDAYLSSLGASGWGMIRAWDADGTPPQYETYFSSGSMTDGFDTEDNVAVVKAGQGYLLFATRNGVIGG